MRQKRYPLLLDTDYPPEQAVLQAIHAVPEGERAAFMRTLILLGHRALEQDIHLKLINGGMPDYGAGTY
jgi:hypothetical protein